jgi:hypothetical protein
VRIGVRQIILGVKGSGLATVDAGVSADPDAGIGAGGAGSQDDSTAVCEGLEHPTEFTISFLLINSTNDEPSGYSPTSWVGEVDLTGPGAPSGVRAGIGENTLVVSWTADASTPTGEMNAFNLYCDPPAGRGPDTDAGTTCSSASLLAGDSPPSGFDCGSTTGGDNEAETSPLTNGIAYTVAVAGRDTFYNVGPLSSTVCETPEPVTGFFEAYRDAGGKAGGGFCAMHAGRSSTALGLFLLSLATAALRRRHPARRDRSIGR